MKFAPSPVYSVKTPDRAPLTTAAIPRGLQTYRSWVVWRYERRDGRLTKVPFVALPVEDRRANTTDSRTWRSFTEALDAYEGSGRSGAIGTVTVNAPWITRSRI
jgi:primase-polymerase (primpol)-like protein